MTPEHEMISMTPVSNWFFGELGKLKSPERKEAFLKTPVARQYFKALGLPENATHEMLRQAVDKSPDLLHKNYHWSDMHDIKKEVGNTLSTKAWNQIGTSDEKGLRLLQGSLGENLRNAFESVSPEAGKAWNRYNSSYEKYAKTKKPSINRIIADVSDPEHAYHAAKGEMDKGGRTFRFALENAKGTQKENIARTFIAEVGDTGKNFSIEKFGPAWDKVPRKVRNMALAALPEEESGRIKDMMKVYDRMQEVVTHDKTGWDFGNRQHGMGVSAFVKKAALRAVTGPHWRGPEGQKHIREAMLHGHQKAPPTGESVKEFAAKSTPRMLAQLFANRLKDS